MDERSPYICPRRVFTSDGLFASIAICPVSMVAVPHKIRAQHNLNANYFCKASVERTAYAYVLNICTHKKGNVY